MTLTTETIPCISAIFGFVGTLFVLYRLLCQRKDATIQLLNERIAALKDKAEDLKSQAPDVLAQQSGEQGNSS